MSETALLAMMGVWSAIITGVFGVVMWVLNRPKHEAEAKQAEMQVYGTMLSSMERMSVVLSQKENRLDKTEKRLDELEELNRKKDFRIAELESMIEELKEAMETKDGQINNLNQLVISLQAEGEKKDHLIGKLQAEIAGLQEQREGDRRLLDKLQQEKDRLESEMALLRGEKDDTVEISQDIIDAARAISATAPVAEKPSPPIEKPTHIGINTTLVLTAPDAAIIRKPEGNDPL